VSPAFIYKSEEVLNLYVKP